MTSGRHADGTRWKDLTGCLQSCPGDARLVREGPRRVRELDALRELLAARFGSPPELPDRTDSDSLELTAA